MEHIAETTWLKLQVAHSANMRTTMHTLAYRAIQPLMAKFSKTTQLCVYVFFVDSDQIDMNIAAFWRGCII